MKSNLILGLVFLIASVPALAAETIRCEVDKAVTGGSKKQVPVLAIRGVGTKKTEEVQFEDEKFSAIWQQGDNNEKQVSLTMRFGEVTSSIYDFNLATQKGPLNSMSKGNLRFQCWAE